MLPGQDLLPVPDLLRPRLLTFHPPLLEEHQHPFVARLPWAPPIILTICSAKNISPNGAHVDGLSVHPLLLINNAMHVFILNFWLLYKLGRLAEIGEYLKDNVGCYWR